MTKQFWCKWEYNLWLSSTDVSLCSPATRGVWFDALNRMMVNGTDSISGTAEELAQACRCDLTAINTSIEELSRRGVADVVNLKGSITLTSRKRRNALKISGIRTVAGSKGGSKTQADLSILLVEVSNSNTFLSYYGVYPKKQNKADAVKAWVQMDGNKYLPEILAALAWQTKLPDWLKESGKYVPLPASYLRGRRWEDEPPRQQPKART